MSKKESRRDQMRLVEHLDELRKRIIRSLIVLVLSIIGGWGVSEPLLSYLKEKPPASGMEWNAFALWDGVRIYLQCAFLIGLSVSLPYILYQIWSFLKPGLHPAEQKAAVRYIPGAVLLFFAGLSFAYFVVFPMAFYFTSAVNQRLELTETYGIVQYFSFMFNILIPISLLFELPIVVMFLTKLGVLNPKRLKKMRRVAYLLLIVVATIVTPPDLISDILVSVPLLLLYEISVMLSSVVYRKRLAQDRAMELQYSK